MQWLLAPETPYLYRIHAKKNTDFAHRCRTSGGAHERMHLANVQNQDNHPKSII